MTSSPDGMPLTDGAVGLALLDRPDEAVRAADQAIRLVPESRDAANGPTVAVQRAWVLICAGGDRAEEGYSELQDRAFAASGGFTPPAPAADPRP